jgi:hypothetical protein
LPGNSLALVYPIQMSVATRHQIGIVFEESSGAGMGTGFWDLKTA